MRDVFFFFCPFCVVNLLRFFQKQLAQNIFVSCMSSCPVLCEHLAFDKKKAGEPERRRVGSASGRGHGEVGARAGGQGDVEPRCRQEGGRDGHVAPS